MTPRQLALAFPHEPRFAGQDFLPAPSNEAARAWLARPAEWPQRRLALWGAEGSGKTHLLHVWAERSQAALRDGPTLRFDGSFPDRPLAIDDADLAPERALLHVLNAAAEAGQPALLAARLPPARWAVRLPDLASRLRAITAVELRAPEDALLRTLLARLLVERQLAVPGPIQDDLLLHLPRTQGAMREIAARLDHASLAEARRVTRPLARRVLAEFLDAAAPEAEDAADRHEDFTSPPAAMPILL